LLPEADYLWWTVSTSDPSTVWQSGVGSAAPDGLVKLTGVNGSRDPDRVVVNVAPVPTLTIVRTSPTEVTLSAFLRAGFSYQLERSTNLVSWGDLGTPATGNNAIVR
jgi:hypothetical protein